MAKREVKEGDPVNVFCGTGKGVRAHLTNPFDAFVHKINGEDAHVIRIIDGNGRPIKAPKWACTHGHASGVGAAKPRFSEMTPAAKSQIKIAACGEMAREVKHLKRKQRTVVLEKQDLIKMHLLAEQVSTKKQKTKLVEAKKVINALKDALVRSDTKSAKKLKLTQDQLSIERATKTEAEKKKIEAEKKVRQAEVAKEKLRLAADKAVRHKCKAVTVKNNFKLKLQEKNVTLKELKADAQDLLMDAKLILRTKERGHPHTCPMERHARSLMAMGNSAPLAREQFMLDASFFLSPEQFALLEFPDERWFQRQREGTGMESWLHAHLKLAKCDTVVQFGFDESEIQGTPTMNQWVWIETEGEREMVTLEAGGMLCGSTAPECIAHFRKTWERGQLAVNMLRERLGVDADRLAPIKDGGGGFIR